MGRLEFHHNLGDQRCYPLSFEKGERVRVEGVRGLRLVVQPGDEEDENE